MTTLTQSSIQAARQWYADNAQACIDEVLAGEVTVNDKWAYFAQCQQSKVFALAGDYDHTIASLQRAHYIQTGECIALLPSY